MKKKIVSVLMAFTMAISSIGIQPVQVEAAVGKKSETAVKRQETDVLGGAGKLLNNVSVEGTNSFGNMLSAEFAEKAEEIEEGNGFFISAIEMEGTKAAVSLEAAEDCTLVVAVYDEAGEEMLAVGSREVTTGEREAVVTIETENMPEYFYLMGYLIDTDSLRPLCSVFESPNYTREVQEFLKKTTEDFDENKVVNLDDDITTNFLVCEEDTRKLSGNEEANRIVSANEETKTYVIENADSSITALKQGDSFVYSYAEGEILAGKIGEITVSGTTVTIVCEDTSLEEVFEYVRIEGESLSQEAEVNEESIGEGFTYLGVSKEQVQGQYYGPNVQGVQGAAKGVEIGGTIHDEISKPLDFKMDLKVKDEKKGEIKITGGLSLGIDASVEFIKTWSYKFLELKLDYTGISEITIEAKLDRQRFKIGELKFSPVPCVNIVLTPEILFEADAKISCTATVTGTIGFQVTDAGMKNITTNPAAEVEAEIEATIYVGFALTPAIEIVSDWVASAEITATVGAEIIGKMTAEVSTEQKYIAKKHTCKACIDGDIIAHMDLNFKASLFHKKEFEKKLLNWSEKVADFYYSFDYGEFKLTSCPHYVYRINIMVQNEKNQSIIGAKVKEKESGAAYTTDALGMVTLWKPSGSYQLEVENEGYAKAEKRYSVEDRAKWVTVGLREEGSGDSGEIERAGKVRSVVLGDFRSAAVMENGDLYMWGNNSHGQLGDGTTKNKPIPVKILENVRSVSLRDYYSAAITRDGSLYMWGDNWLGQLGDGTTNDKLTPVKILESVRSMSLTDYCGAAITEDGSLYMWGPNGTGQLGDGTTNKKLTPVKILENVRSVSLGRGGYSAAITEDESLYMWGDNSHGQLGDGTTNKKLTPIKILENVRSVHLKEYHSAAITKDGSLYMWGDNSHGQLGDGTTKDKLTPVKILENVKSASFEAIPEDIEDGVAYSAAITEDGNLYMWGVNGGGQLGDGTTKDKLIPVKILENVRSMSLGKFHGAAIKENGNLCMWGDNWCGQLGDGTTEDKLIPVKILENVRSVSLGEFHSSAITESGSLYMWGNNAEGQLGDGTTENKQVPTLISFPPESTTYNSSAKNSDSEILNCSLFEESEMGACTVSFKTFTDLKPEAVYNFYIMKTKEPEDKFSSENLFYLKQAKADSKGVLQIEYPSNISVSDAEAFVVCAEQDDIADAQITAKTACYNGKEQFADITVIHNGKTLEAGKDYEIEGSFSAMEVGTYSVIVTGVGNYKGEKTVDWDIKQYRLGDVNCDDKIDSKDALAILKDSVGIDQLVFVKEVADVNKDTKIDSKDALMVLKHSVGILQIS